MAARSTLRRKVVLPVTIIRNDGEQRQLAHTLDITSNSARMAGLQLQVEPGEVIEVQRGALRAKFQVFWVGATGTPLEGQIGTQCIVAGKNIWGIALPPDEPDNLNDPEQFRSSIKLVRSVNDSEEKREHSRLDCSAGVSIQVANSKQPLYARITDISEGGVYVTTTAVLPVSTTVYMRMNIEGFLVEMPGVVRSSDSMIGMGISFQQATQEKHQKLALAIRGLRLKSPKAIRESADHLRQPLVPISLAG
jgi:PilZ domain-containing protein